MNDFKDLDLDYFAPRKPAEPEAKPEKTEAVDAPTADESTEPAERRRKPKPSRRELLNMRLSVLSVGVMVILFALMTLYLLLFPRSTVSQIENRNLAEFPKFSFASYFSGSFTADVATWFDDTVPGVLQQVRVVWHGAVCGCGYLGVTVCGRSIGVICAVRLGLCGADR